jgi:CHRD domain
MTSPIEGKAALTAEQAKDLADGKWYFNLHTAANPGVEVRRHVVKSEEQVRPSARSERRSDSIFLGAFGVGNRAAYHSSK